MIYKLYMNISDETSMCTQYQLVNGADNRIVGTAKDIKRGRFLFVYNGTEYQFSTFPKIVEKSCITFKYPIVSKRKKTIGFNVLSNEKEIAYYYNDVAFCKKKGFIKQNIGLTVLNYLGEKFVSFRVGFANKNSHYYCVYNYKNQTVGIIERHNFDNGNCKATIYVENEEYIIPTLLVCAEEMMVFVINNTNDYTDKVIDDSAGRYISVLQEEKDLFDPNFIPKIKAMDGIVN